MLARLLRLVFPKSRIISVDLLERTMILLRACGGASEYGVFGELRALRDAPGKATP